MRVCGRFHPGQRTLVEGPDCNTAVLNRCVLTKECREIAAPFEGSCTEGEQPFQAGVVVTVNRACIRVDSKRGHVIQQRRICLIFVGSFDDTPACRRRCLTIMVDSRG